MSSCTDPHIITGTCFENPSNARDVSSMRHEFAACWVISRGFSCAADVSEAALNVILGANHNQMSTEHYCHVAAMNITVSGSHNLQSKLRAAIRSSSPMIHLADSGQRSCVSVADFFNSFENHHKSVLIAIAVFHRIQLPSFSGRCAQFSQSHSPNPLPPEVSLPDCADVCEEWHANSIDPDLQVHVLTTLSGSKVTLNPLRCLLTGLSIDYNHSESFWDLRKKLHDHIIKLRRGKRAESNAVPLYHLPFMPEVQQTASFITGQQNFPRSCSGRTQESHHN
jgi:hypothetical protein